MPSTPPPTELPRHVAGANLDTIVIAPNGTLDPAQPEKWTRQTAIIRPKGWLYLPQDDGRLHPITFAGDHLKIGRNRQCVVTVLPRQSDAGS